MIHFTMPCAVLKPYAWRLTRKLGRKTCTTWKDGKQGFLEYGSAAGNDFLYESSLRLRDHMPLLKMALQKQPSSINLLLYRSKQVRDDFEEDTYLDMHIYQNRQANGQKATGLENYARRKK